MTHWLGWTTYPKTDISPRVCQCYHLQVHRCGGRGGSHQLTTWYGIKCGWEWVVSRLSKLPAHSGPLAPVSTEQSILHNVPSEPFSHGPSIWAGDNMRSPPPIGLKQFTNRSIRNTLTLHSPCHSYVLIMSYCM